MNCGPWSNFLILFTQPAAIICFLLLAVFPAVFHTIRLTLCFCKTGEIDNLSVSCWAKFWFVSVQIPRWCKLPSARGSQHQQPSDRSSSPTGPIKPWVDYSRENFCCLHHNLPLGVHQHVAIKLFSGAVAGEVLIITIIIILKYSPVNQAPAVFWRRCRGLGGYWKGESLSSNLFTLFFVLF